MLGFLVRRLVWAAATVVLTAFFAYGMIRVMRPELYPGEATLGGLSGDVSRALLHLDLGESCMFVGCPPLRRIWLDGIWADLFLLAGGVAIGVGLGVLGGVWCAARPRSRASRALESVAMLFYCAPVYVAGYLSLLMFAPPFGFVQLVVPPLGQVATSAAAGVALTPSTTTAAKSNGRRISRACV